MVHLPALPLAVCPQAVHVGVEEDQDEGQEEVEDEPDVDHLDIGSGGKVITHADKHCC